MRQPVNVGFEHYSLIEIDKADTIHSSPPFSLQTFDILRVPSRDLILIKL
jgi:hypothetical protein